MTDPGLFSAHYMAVACTTALVVFCCVLLHYEVFTWLTRVLANLHLHIRRRRILLLILGLLTLHIAEIWMFGIGYFALLNSQSFGLQGFSQIQGSEGGLLDLVYYSASVYTTLGFGDLIPVGAIRFMTGTEALTGFVLITWSASFTFLEMQKFWKND